MKPSDIDGSIPVGDEQLAPGDLPEDLLGMLTAGPPRFLWVITHDLLWDQEMIEQGCKCRVGVGNAQEAEQIIFDWAATFGTGSLKQFKLSDDDGMPYYIGCLAMTDFSDPMTSPRLMDPLHNFGEPDAGCISMHVFSKEKGWELI